MSAQAELTAVSTVNKSSSKWILPLCVSLVSFVAVFSIMHVSPDFNERHVEWLEGAYIAAGIVFLWSTIRLIWVITKSERRGEMLVIAGFGIIAVAWFAGTSLPGILVGVVVVVTGLSLLIKHTGKIG